MLEILEFTEAKLATLTTRSEKHGDEDVPAVSLGIEMTVPNTMLDGIDPKLRPTLYAPKPDETPELPGVDASTPILRCHSIDRVKLTSKCEGWTLNVDDGADESLASAFGGCKVDGMSVEPMNGGSVILRLRVGTSDLDAARSGMLGMHVGQRIWITLRAPEKVPEAIDGTTGHPGANGGASAEDLFAAGADGPDPADEEGSEGGEPDAGQADPQRGDNPRDGVGAAEQVPQDAAHELVPKKRRGKASGAAVRA